MEGDRRSFCKILRISLEVREDSSGSNLNLIPRTYGKKNLAVVVCAFKLTAGEKIQAKNNNLIKTQQPESYIGEDHPRLCYNN